MSTQRGYGPHGAPVHHGYLVKRAVGKRRAIGKQVPSWRQRYLILSDSELAWHEQAEVSESGDVTIKSRLLGALPVTKECVLTENADSANGKRDYTFSVKSGAHVLVLQAASEEERQEWVAHISRIIQPEGTAPKSTRTLTIADAASAPLLPEEADPADEEADVEGAEGQAERSPSNPVQSSPIQSDRPQSSPILTRTHPSLPSQNLIHPILSHPTPQATLFQTIPYLTTRTRTGGSRGVGKGACFGRGDHRNGNTKGGG